MLVVVVRNVLGHSAILGSDTRSVAMNDYSEEVFLQLERP
jgi:hypothetical protein